MFLKIGTDWHNNTAEMDIRQNMIICKITNGHCLEDDTNTRKMLMNIKETCRIRDLNFHDHMEEYLGNFTSKL